MDPPAPTEEKVLVSSMAAAAQKHRQARHESNVQGWAATA